MNLKNNQVFTNPTDPNTCHQTYGCQCFFKRVYGYTLVELMVVITVLGIMLASAVPAYSNFTRSSREMQATTQLQKIALRLQQHYNETMSYQTTLNDLNLPVQDSWYRYQIDSIDRKQYTIFALPLAANSARKEFSLNQHGMQRYRFTGSSQWVTGWS
ncbi:MAG: prepilin-type N-terminal cleavage/methylation domain-containing protein [Acidiferrobacterales bacterium]|nr:prepilin-type N-terminal cleavage/methylation domain-containing protein [Acidiferrobacterales bacterium]